MDYPINQPLPPLTCDAPGELLSAWIARNPGFIAKAQTAATSAWTAARALPGLTTRVDAMWTFFVSRTRQASEPIGQLRVAIQAHAVLRALAGLSREHLAALSDRYASSFIGGRVTGDEIAAKVQADVRAAMTSHPDLAWYQEQQDARDAAIADLQARQQAEQHEAYIRARPAVLLKSLRSRKVALALDDEGRITVPAGTALSASDVAAIKADRAGLVELLQAEAEAARPRVIA